MPHNTVSDPDMEVTIFRAALKTVQDETQQLYERALLHAREEAEIFQAHIMLLEDSDSLCDPVEQAIRSERKCAAWACEEQFDQVYAMLSGLEDAYMRQRAADILDLKSRVLGVLLDDQTQLCTLPEHAILVARDLMPSDTIKLDFTRLVGIVCEEGSQTSHTAILSKAMGIPAVMGCNGILHNVCDGATLLLNAASGEVICNPSAEEISAFAELLHQQEQSRKRLQAYRGKKSQTADGHMVSLLGNIASADECKTAMEYDCEGIGLFRSEFLYMNGTLPDEQTQVQAYKLALLHANGKPVTIRTLDIGGDKKLPALPLPAEENPFLGYRAIRICLKEPALFKTQLRALLRASAFGPLRIMLPMICCVEELRQAKQWIVECKQELLREQIAFDASVKVGIMVEVPAVAIAADMFAKECDFFSIGTNDLCQYTLAVDRGNSAIASLYTHYHPSVVRLIANTIAAAERAGIPCCMCGEAAGDLTFIPLLVGLGLQNFSMAPPLILRAREVIHSISYQQWRKKSTVCCSMPTQELKQHLQAQVPQARSI